MAKIWILLDISPEISIFYISIFSLKISIFSPSADAPFPPPLSSHTHLRKENTPIHGPTSTLITFKFINRCEPPCSTTSPLHHPIYGAGCSHITIAASSVACPDIAPLDLCATDTECRRGKNQWWWPQRW